MNIRYYNIAKNWTKKIEPLLVLPAVNDILVRDFNKFTMVRYGKRFVPGDKPFDFESCDWWVFHRGKRPRYWDYVKHSACHWLVNFNLKLAQLTSPTKPWRVLTSDLHSTVFDGQGTLFDMNFLALGVKPGEAYKMATSKQNNCEEIPVGKELEVPFLPPETPEIARLALEALGLTPTQS